MTYVPLRHYHRLDSALDLHPRILFARLRSPIDPIFRIAEWLVIAPPGLIMTINCGTSKHIGQGGKKDY
jgi:hypothetical protein